MLSNIELKKLPTEKVLIKNFEKRFKNKPHFEINQVFVVYFHLKVSGTEKKKLHIFEKKRVFWRK